LVFIEKGSEVFNKDQRRPPQTWQSSVKDELTGKDYKMAKIENHMDSMKQHSSKFY
jgi:predicted transglutaminase-like protease